ncbi:DUF917 domain-containing protein [Streptomyces shenzhenensis]|nr:DUF917 domain-containing protein [Streptomyces shenzhenensis]
MGRPSALVPPESVRALAVGAAFLGSGGGGRAEENVAQVARALAERPVALVGVEELDATAALCAVAQIGAPLIGTERLGGDELPTSVAGLEGALGRRITALVCLEIGGQNALVALSAAARLAVPLVDGDAMGRAFPGIHQTTLTLGGMAAVPMVCASPAGYTITLNGALPNDQAETVVRQALPALGGRAATALYPAAAEHYRHHLVRGSFTRCIALGTALLTWLARPEPSSPPDPALRDLGVELVHTGTIAAVDRGLHGATVVARGFGAAPGGSVVRIDATTEFRRVLVDGRVVADLPDIIAVCDTRHGRVLTFDEVQPGLSVAVLRMPAPPAWYTPAGRVLAAMGDHRRDRPARE